MDSDPIAIVLDRVGIPHSAWSHHCHVQYDLVHRKYRISREFRLLANEITCSERLLPQWTTFGTFRIVGSSWAWRIPSILQALPSVLQCTLIWFAPESPRWLISKGRDQEAKEVLGKYHGNGDLYHPLVDVSPQTPICEDNQLIYMYHSTNTTRFVKLSPWRRIWAPSRGCPSSPPPATVAVCVLSLPSASYVLPMNTSISINLVHLIVLSMVWQWSRQLLHQPHPRERRHRSREHQNPHQRYPPDLQLHHGRYIRHVR